MWFASIMAVKLLLNKYDAKVVAHISLPNYKKYRMEKRRIRVNKV